MSLLAPVVTYEAPFFYLDGSYVAPVAASGVANAAINYASGRMADLALRLQDGSISLADWYAQMQAEVLNMHAAEYALARGGFENMTVADWERVADAMGPKLDLLHGFAEDIAFGRYGVDVSARSFNARVNLWANDGRSSYENEYTRVQQENGATRAKRVLGGGVQSCQECLDLAGEGFMAIEEMTPIGDCTCGANCHCVVVHE